MLVGGVRLVVDDALCVFSERVQVRFPRSKKRRIRKKWAADPRNYRSVLRERIVRMGDVWLVSSAAAAKLKAKVGAAVGSVSVVGDPTIRPE